MNSWSRPINVRRLLVFIGCGIVFSLLFTQYTTPARLSTADVPAYYFNVSVTHSLVPKSHQSVSKSTYIFTDSNLFMSDYKNIPTPPYIARYQNPCFQVHYSAQNAKKLTCLPYFMIGGFPKTGTTDLYKRMLRHPHINGPAKGKEPLWWSICRYGRKSLSVYAKDIGKAGNIYNSGGGAKASWHPAIVGDFSTREMMQERSPWVEGENNVDFMHHLMPNLRLIVLMREPVARLYSDYVYFSRKYVSQVSPENFHIGVQRAVSWWHNCTAKHDVRDCLYGTGPKDMPQIFSGAPFHACWKPFQPGNICGYFRVGFYHYYIEDFLKKYKREQFIFVRSEDYARKPDDIIWNDILPFLNVTRNISSKGAYTKGTSSGNPVKSKLVATGKYRPMLNSTRLLLEELYASSKQKLAKLLGDDKYLWKDIA